MRVLLLIVVLILSACGSNGTESVSNQASPELVAFNKSAAKAQSTALELSKLVLGPEGIADRTQATRKLPLTTGSEIRAWRIERDALRSKLELAIQQSAQFALELGSVEQNRRAFLALQALDFPMIYIDDFDAIQQPLVLEALAIATLSIGAYRFLKGFGELADNTQRMVYTTAEGEPTSRAAVIKVLKNNGVQISDTASAEEVIAIFDKQGRDLRRKITSQVEAWNEDQFTGKTGEADAALERFEEARAEVPDIANEGGALAVTQTVAFVQSVTGGVGSVIGGAPGASVDLVLTATEMNPTDIVQRRVTVYVTAGEKEALPTQTSPTSPTVARETIEKAAAGDPSINPDQIVDAAVALIQEVADGLRVTFGPTVQIAKKFALSGGSLLEKRQDDGSFKQDLTLSLPHFAEGEMAEVVIVREGMLPQEVINHILSANNPIVLDTPPLPGTMTVESKPGLASAESQVFNVTVTVARVAHATHIICQGTNVVCTPSITALPSEGSVAFAVEVFGRGELRLIRKDTGESYSLILKATTPQNNTPANLDPKLIGKWSFKDSEGGVYSWIFNADGGCKQVIPGGTYDWQWTIENGRLKLFVDGGKPAFKTYKIEGNLVYFWVDEIEDWSLPLARE